MSDGTIGSIDREIDAALFNATPAGIPVSVVRHLLALHWCFEAAKRDTRWRKWLWLPVLWCLERLLPGVP